MRGDQRQMGDRLIMQGTGGPFVHTEFLLGKGADIRCYTACGSPSRHEAREGFVPTRHLTDLPVRPEWDVITFPVHNGTLGYNRVYALILQLIATQIPYNYKDLWQCCVKVMLPYERDVDCSNPLSWQKRGVFCSQACLLLLRHLSNLGLITLPQSMESQVRSINSRGCSPNALHRIVGAGRACRQKKEANEKGGLAGGLMTRIF